MLPCKLDVSMPNTNENLSKKELRAIYRSRRDDMNAHEREALSLKIWDRLYETDKYTTAVNVLAYASIGSEINTKPFIVRALKDGKRVFCPKIIDTQIEFFRIESPSELIPAGVYEIPEPTRGNTPDYECETIIIVPALAVDKKGYRLGYGKGFYDRYLQKCKETVISHKIIAICGIFPSFLTNSLPISDYDISIDMIITEQEIIII
jgi:5-formyltetrahydrofolate cyclo-ligase